ncbi:beta-ketoacyl synthase N-terminal-like domain-containing protein [Roseateles flavus]|uniref:Beta-ketoacyl synthase N-terminal-like domain-containing protein n=1 Tax=Roseateles flavus TaxID=3149041 RepID=A0ABV0GBJ5_9BURK
MPSFSKPELLITGLGIVSAVGQGRAAFADALFSGDQAFDVMRRPGRQGPVTESSEPGAVTEGFLGAEIQELRLPASMAAQERTTSWSTKAAIVCLQEAWQDAGLSDVDPQRIALVVGGSNFQQRELVLVQDAYRARRSYLRPSYGLTFMDSDLCGACTEQFGIKGGAFTVGGASASGQLVLLQACQMIEAGQVDVCIALGALMDLSYWECQGFRALGAMGSDRYAREPAAASRPFDRQRDGFIYGECSGALVVERADRRARRGRSPYARILGRGLHMDAHRNPDPSMAGELAAMSGALAEAGLTAQAIDYVNPHGSGSLQGDETELRALAEAGLMHARINATKSIVGHGLTAAGTVEVIATLLQMEHQMLHPSRNLHDPIDDRFNWVRGEAVPASIHRALKLSFGFGGINTAVCLERC